MSTGMRLEGATFHYQCTQIVFPEAPTLIYSAGGPERVDRNFSLKFMNWLIDRLDIWRPKPGHQADQFWMWTTGGLTRDSIG